MLWESHCWAHLRSCALLSPPCCNRRSVQHDTEVFGYCTASRHALPSWSQSWCRSLALSPSPLSPPCQSCTHHRSLLARTTQCQSVPNFKFYLNIYFSELHDDKNVRFICRHGKGPSSSNTHRFFSKFCINEVADRNSFIVRNDVLACRILGGFCSMNYSA